MPDKLPFFAGLLASRAKQHPKCESGEWTEAEFIEYLLSAFEQPDSKDGVVSLSEFISYYTAVSWCVTDDASFEHQLKRSWSLL